MSAITITLGFTKSDRANDYVSFTDGYRPGAEQTRQTITVQDIYALRGADRDAAIALWLDACYAGTNAPELADDPDGAIALVAAALADTDIGGKVRSLSVGDTVTLYERTFACSKMGWTEVTGATGFPE